MVDLLLTVIFDALLEKYSIQGSEDFVIELDSSTEGSKFALFSLGLLKFNTLSILSFLLYQPWLGVF